MPVLSVIYAVQASFSLLISIVNIPLPSPPLHVGMVQLPPTTNATPIVPPAVDSTDAGVLFQQVGLEEEF